MPSFEFVEGAEIDAEISKVFNVLLDMNNWQKWWPGHLNTIRGNEEVVQKGSIVEIKVKGYAPISLNLFEKTTDIFKNKSIKGKWSGDLVGSYEWTLEPINGRTLVRFHIKAKSNRRLITFFSLFVSPTKIFSKIMQSGFKGLQNYLSKGT